MNVRIVTFARIREITGSESFSFDCPDESTVADLKLQLAAQFPDLQEWLPRCSVSINQVYAADETVLPDGSEVGLIPPVSGG